MSSFAKTVCPKCGAVKQHHLGGWGFYCNETTRCSCGHEYSNVPNCIEDIPDREKPPVNRLAGFTTSELEAELKRRRG